MTHNETIKHFFFSQFKFKIFHRHVFISTSHQEIDSLSHLVHYTLNDCNKLKIILFVSCVKSEEGEQEEEKMFENTNKTAKLLLFAYFISRSFRK